MAIAFGIDNIMIFFTALSPIIFASFFIISSFFNADLKGIIWLLGMFITQGIAAVGRSALGKIAPHPWLKEGRMAKASELPTHDFCEIFEPMFESGRMSVAIDSHALFHGFTLTYLILGNSANPHTPGNFFIVFYSIVAILDLLYRQMKGCVYDIMLGTGLGIIIGAALSIGWFSLITGLKFLGYNFVFFGSDLEASKCKLSKRTFKCKMANSANLMGK